MSDTIVRSRMAVPHKTDFLTQLLEPSRAKLLRLFALHDKERFTALEAAKRSGVSAAVAAREIRALLKLGVIVMHEGEGKSARERAASKRYSWNDKSRCAHSLLSLVRASTPEHFNEVEKALRGIGKLAVIVLSGMFVGDNRRPADILIAGDFVNEKRLEKAMRSFEPKYGREIRYAIFSTPEFRYRLTVHDKLLRDTLDYPHRVLLDKRDLL